MRFHYNGEIAPLMEGVSFIEGNIDVISEMYFEVISKSFDHPNIVVEKKKVTGSLRDVVTQLLPFLYTPKVIFIPTKSSWVAFTDNEKQVQVLHSSIVGKKLNCKILNVFARINSFGKTINGWGGGTFAYYLEDYYNPIRLLELTWQEKWDFEQYGEPFPFEEVDKYSSKYARDRFTLEMLDKYCKAFGIDFFNEDFYMPEGSKAVIIERKYKEYSGPDPISLEERRKTYGFL